MYLFLVILDLTPYSNSMYVSFPHTREGTKITEEDPGTPGLRRNKDEFGGEINGPHRAEIIFP